MENEILSIIIGLGGLLIGYLLAKISYLRKIRIARRDAVKRSKSVLHGHASEKLAPFLPGFPYQARDMNFIGKGVDYIVFDGLTRGYVDQVILLEIKSGQAKQNKNEKLIEQAIKSGRMSYEIWRK